MSAGLSSRGTISYSGRGYPGNCEMIGRGEKRLGRGWHLRRRTSSAGSTPYEFLRLACSLTLDFETTGGRALHYCTNTFCLTMINVTTSVDLQDCERSNTGTFEYLLQLSLPGYIPNVVLPFSLDFAIVHSYQRYCTPMSSSTSGNPGS